MWSGTNPDTRRQSSIRTTTRRRDVLRAFGLGGLTGLAGCAGGDQTPTDLEPTEGPGGETGTPAATATPAQSARQVRGTWISGNSTDAESLFWIQVADSPSASRVGLALDGAYAVTHEEEVFPLWLDIDTDDKRVYECTLRDNLQWSDPYGKMTADDWVYMITEVFQAEDNWAGYVSPSDWQQNGEYFPVEQSGELTFEIRLPEPDPAFPLKPVMWGQYCLPRGLIEQYAADKDVQGFKQDEDIQTLGYAGNLGPFTFERWNRESEFVATRNPDYYMHDVEDISPKWQGAPYFEENVKKVIPEESTRLSALRTGEITAASIPPDKVSRFEGLDAVTVVQTPQPFNTLLVYNQRANGWAPFRRTGVRRALGYALDKRTIVETIRRGHASVAHTFQPKWSRWYDDDQVVETGVGDAYDPARAREELAAALPSGYTYEGDRLIYPEGDPVTLDMVYAIGSETTKTEAEFIAQAYADVGIELKLTSVQFNTMLSKYVRNSTPPDVEPEWNSGPFNGGNRGESTSEQAWDLMYGIRFNTYPRTPTDTSGFWEKRGSVNFFGYVPSVEMASLYDTAATSVDEAERQAALTEIFGVLSQDQPCNFINMAVSIGGYDARVSGFGPREFGFGWDSNTWYFAA